MLRHVILAVTLTVTIPMQASAESWLCIADMSSGLSYDKTLGKWEHAKFDVDSSRSIIKRSNNPSLTYEVHKFGEISPFPMAFCKGEPNSYGYLSCDALYGQFKFNNNNLRYIKTYIAGYVEVTAGGTVVEGDDTPYVEIGRCSKI